jgi:hypothetical protein
MWGTGSELRDSVCVFLNAYEKGIMMIHVYTYMDMYICPATSKLRYCATFFMGVYWMWPNRLTGMLSFNSLIHYLENCALLGHYAASGGNFLRTFRDQ